MSSFVASFLRPLGLTLILAAAFAGPALAADAAARPVTEGSVRNVSWTTIESGSDPIPVIQGTSVVLRFDRHVTRAAISNPEICDITTIGERDVLVNAKQTGTVNLLTWDENNDIASYLIECTLNFAKLGRVLNALDPTGDLKIVTFNNTAAVYGTVNTSLQLKQVNEAVKAFDKSAVNFVRLRESRQILLEVRFAEVNRKGNQDFRLDLEGFGKNFALRSLTGGTGASSVPSTSSYRPTGGAIAYEPIGLPTEQTANLFGSFVSDKFLISNYLRMLEQRNILKIIARPNLVAKEGEEASFIVGGEFPVPLATRDGIQISYKEFGTRLKFTPETLDDKMIRLTIDTEVSELDFSTTLTVNGSVVPSLIKRNHKTVAELEDNQSLVIGGLITQKVNRINRKVPVFGDIPLIGDALFKSLREERTDVELLVVITPHLVKPMRLGEAKEFYDPEKVKDALRILAPAYEEPQADTINSLVRQAETTRPFPEKPLSGSRRR